MALLAPRFRSHALLGLPVWAFSLAMIELVAARAGPPSATVPRRAAARTRPAARDAAAGVGTGSRSAARVRANEDRLAVIAATFVPLTIRSPPRRHALRRDQPHQQGSARPCGGGRGRFATRRHGGSPPAGRMGPAPTKSRGAAACL